MTLEKFFHEVPDNYDIRVWDRFGYHMFAEYNGRDSIPVELNSLEIHGIFAPDEYDRYDVYLTEYYGTLCELLEGVE